MDHHDTGPDGLRIGYLGNFRPPHSTENEVRRALLFLGHDVTTFQEDDPEVWGKVTAAGPDLDLVLWTKTWHGPIAAFGMLDDLRAQAVPVVGYHLDRWWGLDRQVQVEPGPDREPFFDVDVLFTADGGHDAAWAAAGVSHLWAPPAVSARAAVPGTARLDYRSDVAFVGSWSTYHPEWKHRTDLIGYLGRVYGRRFALWPRGGRSVRGAELSDLYASVGVVVGDSCLLPATDGTPIARYWSDRIPETVGRAGRLVHPWVPGLDVAFDGTVPTWGLGQFTELRRLIDRLLDQSPTERAEALDQARTVVLEHHTYEVRMAGVLASLTDLGVLA